MKMWKNMWWAVLIAAITIIYIIILIILIHRFVRSTYSVLDVKSLSSQSFDLHFDGIGIKPGETYEYDVKLKPDVEGDFRVTLKFEVKKSTGLEQYMKFGVDLDKNSTVFEDSFKEVLRKEEVAFDVVLTSHETTIITLVFSMPKDVENEAMGKTIDFTMNMTIEGK